MHEKLSTWQEVQERLVEYIPALTGSYAALQNLSNRITGGRVTRLHAKTSIEKDGLKVIATKGKGTFSFWVKPVFRDIQFIGVSISSEKDVAPHRVYMDLIKPMADMLRKETSVRVELKIIPK